MKTTKMIAVILGGGKGTRLYPLTKDRSKPAVPFAGKYRLVDIPISNCINSGYNVIYLLTQFNSASLHHHISKTYTFDSFGDGFVELLAAEQTPQSSSWYQGTADAVRKNLKHFSSPNAEYCLLLSGDQLYRMDFNDMLAHHIKTGAEITIAGKTISRAEATGLGVIGASSTSRITKFVEKPSPDADISDLRINEKFLKASLNQELNEKNEYIASMGIYIFNMKTLYEVLDNDKDDFGKEIIPDSIKNRHVSCYLFDGFWEDIGTIKAFYNLHQSLVSIDPPFNFYDEKNPIYTHRRFLPATKINMCNFVSSLAAEGSIITNASVHNSIIGVRMVVEKYSSLDGVYCMGANWYETKQDKQANRENGIPNLGIGENTHIARAIVDMNARIGDNCRIGVDPIDRKDGDYENYSIRDGIIVIHKGAVIPNGTVI